MIIIPMVTVSIFIIDGIMIIIRNHMTAVVVDVAIPSDGNIRKKDQKKKLEKYQWLKEELEKM